MRKLTMIALALVLAGASVAHADEYVKGGFEMGGAINTGLGFQFADSNAANYGAMNGFALANPYGGVQAGPLGEFNRYNGGAAFSAVTPASPYSAGSSTKSFQFYLDGVQLNLSKSFGENIRARADLVFGNGATGGSIVTTAGAAVNVAQAYVTANIPAGNGLEFLVGEFFTPFGYEKVFRNENNTVTHSEVFFLRPTTLTGIKFYYSFTDLIDLHVYAFNNMHNNLGDGVSKNMPGLGATLGFNWGDEGKKSNVAVTAMGGPEGFGNTTGGKSTFGHFTMLGDVTMNWHINDTFTLGFEGLYRMDGSNSGTPKQKIMAALVDLNYAFTDVWDGTFKLAYAHQNNTNASFIANNGAIGALGGLLSGGAGSMSRYQAGLATQYQIADGAKVQAEFRIDYSKAVNTPKSLNYGPIVNFAYAF